MTRKNALLRAAKILFAEYGYEGTTFKKISDRAGVALGLLSHHFGSKERLFVAATTDILEDLERILLSAIEEEPNGFHRILRYCRAYMNFAEDKDSHYELLSRCIPYNTISQSDKRFLFPKIESIYSILPRCLAEGKADGSIDVDVPDSTADMIFCTLIGSRRVKLLRAPLSLRFELPDMLSLLERALTSPTANPPDSHAR